MYDKKKTAEYNHVKEVLGNSELIDRLRTDKHGTGFIFSLYLSKEFVESDIDCLDLSVRASNCLKRAGIQTVGELIRRVDRASDLKGIRNCGRTSIIEIMDKLFYYNYICLKTDKRAQYIQETIERNQVL